MMAAARCAWRFTFSSAPIVSSRVSFPAWSIMLAPEAVAESGHEQWFEPLFSPDSGEVESGLFALQAAIGAGILGYCLGRLHGRRRERAAAGRDADPTTIPAAEAAAAGTSPDIAHPIEPHRRTAGSATP